jgi:hypothetical protein
MIARHPSGRMSWLPLRYVAPSPMELRKRRMKTAAVTLIAVFVGSLALVIIEMIADAVRR